MRLERVPGRCLGGTRDGGLVTVQLPSTFSPTHETGGLPGYPAIDVFGDPLDEVAVTFYGWVRRISGRPPSQGGRPGGSYGWSVYLLNRVNGWERFVTHLHVLYVTVGDNVAPGDCIGRIADSAVSGKPGTSHAHLGLRQLRG
jgi:hypothetical protein